VENQERTAGKPAEVEIAKPSIEAIRGRVMIGRPLGAKVQVANREELLKACSRIGDAYKKSDPDAMIWPAHVIIIRHDGRWAEALIHINTASQSFAEEVERAIIGIRDTNAARPPSS